MTGPDREPHLEGGHAPLVDWARTARRLRAMLIGLGVAVVASWLAVGAVQGDLRPRMLGELAGLAVLLAVALEVVVVGGAAIRGMLAAGARGDRLASDDVSLIPPQLAARLRARRR